jgi:hypothetical protein
MTSSSSSRPSGAGPPRSVTVLLNATPASFGAFRDRFPGPLEWQARGAGTQAWWPARAAARLPVTLALGITAAIIVSSAADQTAATAGNLPDTQILVWTGQPGGGHGPDGPVVPVRTPAGLASWPPPCTRSPERCSTPR